VPGSVHWAVGVDNHADMSACGFFFVPASINEMEVAEAGESYPQERLPRLC
jgi:hypothetical protein